MAKIHVVTSSAGEPRRFAFRCPGCDQTHMIDTSWQFDGDLERPTISPSIFVNGDPAYFNPGVPKCHSYVRDGRIEFLSDCSHSMAGQTVDLPEW